MNQRERRPGMQTGTAETSWATSVNAQGTAHHDATGDVVDQAIADACTVRGCACDADVTVTRDGPIRRVTVAHDPWCPALGGGAT